MCRETIRAAIVGRFRQNEQFIFDSEEYEDLVSFRQNLYKASDIKAAEELIDKLRICDPAVGSGHF